MILCCRGLLRSCGRKGDGTASVDNIETSLNLDINAFDEPEEVSSVFSNNTSLSVISCFNPSLAKFTEARSLGGFGAAGVYPWQQRSQPFVVLRVSPYRVYCCRWYVSLFLSALQAAHTTTRSILVCHYQWSRTRAVGYEQST